jgi:ribosomal protein L4
MIKRMSFLAPRAGMSREAFVDYGRTVHAPKAARMPGIRITS